MRENREGSRKTKRTETGEYKYARGKTYAAVASTWIRVARSGFPRFGLSVKQTRTPTAVAACFQIESQRKSWYFEFWTGISYRCQKGCSSRKVRCSTTLILEGAVWLLQFSKTLKSRKVRGEDIQPRHSYRSVTKQGESWAAGADI